MKILNKFKGKLCESIVNNELRSKCSTVLSLRKGADFLCITRNGDPRLIEAKYGKSSLTNHQRKTKELAKALGIPYEVQRCNFPGFE